MGPLKQHHLRPHCIDAFETQRLGGYRVKVIKYLCALCASVFPFLDQVNRNKEAVKGGPNVAKRR